MNDHASFPPVPADDGELLSSYLDGELDEAQAGALESRIEADPDLADRLERTREVVEVLAGLHATPPEGFGDRLRQRLEAERGAPSLEGRRTSRRSRWAPLGAVAAAVLAVAVLGGLAVTAGLTPGGQDAALETADAPVAGVESAEDAGRTLLDADDDEVTEEGFAAESDQDADDDDLGVPATVPAEPAVVEAGTELAGDDDARAYFRGLDEAAAFLGMPHEQATQLAPAFTVALRHAEAFSGGVPPDRCLDEVARGEEGPVVPIRVERVTYAGGEALAYLVASATEPEGPLDRVAGWIVESEGCATRLYSPVASAP